MIPRELRKRLWEHSHGRARGPEGPITGEVARVLFPHGAMTIRELRRRSGTAGRAPRKSLKSAMRRLVRRGIICMAGGTYSLTDLGRWLVISRRLGLGFPSLCILAVACCIQHRHVMAGSTWFYTIESFADVFGEYYSENYIEKIFSVLRRKRYATKYVRRAIAIPAPVCKCLMARYGPMFEQIESWMEGLKAREYDIFSSLQERTEGFKIPCRQDKDSIRSRANSSARTRGPAGS